MLARLGILPDELAPGYFGRVLRFNGLRNEGALNQSLLNWAGVGKTSLRDVSRAELLAKLVDMPLDSFLALHTLLPYLDATTDDRTRGYKDPSKKLWGFAFRPLREGAYFCSKCVQEDLSFHGVSFWRRGHQLPGRYVCPKHASPLLCVSEGSPFLQSPSDYLNSGQIVKPGLVRAHENAYVQRFLEMSDSVLSSSEPAEGSVVRTRLIRRANALEFSRTETRSSTARYLSQVVREVFDADWLESVLPVLNARNHERFIETVDGVLNQSHYRLSTTPALLACSVLFDSADEGAQVLRRDLTDEPVLRQRKPRSEETSIDEEKVRALYFENNGCHFSVIQQLGAGVSPWLVRKSLRNLGLPSLKNYKLIAPGLQRALDEVIEGDLSISQASEKYEMDAGVLRRLLKTGTTPLRQALEKVSQDQMHANTSKVKTRHFRKGNHKSGNKKLPKDGRIEGRVETYLPS